MDLVIQTTKGKMEYNFIIFSEIVAIGFVIGMLTGIFGVGGGFLLTPALMIILGVPGQIAVGTGLAAIFPNSILGILKRRGSSTIDYRLAIIISFGSIIGVIIGSHILDVLKNMPKFEIFGNTQDPVQYILLFLFLIVLIIIASYLYLDYKKNDGKAPIKRIGYLSKFKVPPYMHFQSLEEPALSVIGVLFLGLVIGTLTGFMGIGGGVILLPVLIYMVGQRTNKAAGTSLILVGVSSFVAVIRKSAGGDIDVILLIALLTGGMIGTFVGTKIGLRLSGPKIRLYFVYVVLTAILMVSGKLYFLTF